MARDIWPLVRNLGQTLCVLGWVLGDLSYAWLFQGRSQEKYQKNRGSRGGVTRDESSYAKTNYLIVLKRCEIAI